MAENLNDLERQFRVGQAQPLEAITKDADDSHRVDGSRRRRIRTSVE